MSEQLRMLSILLELVLLLLQKGQRNMYLSVASEHSYADQRTFFMTCRYDCLKEKHLRYMSYRSDSEQCTVHFVRVLNIRVHTDAHKCGNGIRYTVLQVMLYGKSSERLDIPDYLISANVLLLSLPCYLMYLR